MANKACDDYFIRNHGSKVQDGDMAWQLDSRYLYEPNAKMIHAIDRNEKEGQI